MTLWTDHRNFAGGEYCGGRLLNMFYNRRISDKASRWIEEIIKFLPSVKEICFVAGEVNVVADALSRLPMGVSTEWTPSDEHEEHVPRFWKVIEFLLGDSREIVHDLVDDEVSGMMRRTMLQEEDYLVKDDEEDMILEEQGGVRVRLAEYLLVRSFRSKDMIMFGADSGSVDQCREHLDRYFDNGVTTAALSIMPFPGVNVHEAIEGLAPQS